MTKRLVIILCCCGVVAGLAATSVFYTLIFPGPEIIATDEELAELRQIERSSPEADAVAAIALGD